MVAHIKSKYGPSGAVRWKCQRRACRALIEKEEIACYRCRPALPASLIVLAERTASLHPASPARRRVLLAADAAWQADAG